MGNLLSIHAIPTHGRPEDLDYAGALRPNVLKFVDADAYTVEQYFKRAPDTQIIFLRDWALSEQKEDMRRDPAGTGRRHADEWAAKIDGAYSALPRERIIVAGINEPEVWIDMSVVPYTVAFLDRLAEHGLRGAALNLSVGWPANTGPDTLPDWTPFAPVYEAIMRGNHVLVLHEYWDERGSEYNWGWWAGRFEACPWDVPIVIGECGIDKYVSDPMVAPEMRGWQGWMPAGAYAEQVVRYLQRCAADGRIVGATLYTTDYGHPWQSFDTFPARKELAAVYVPTAGQAPDSGAPSTPPPTQPAPIQPSPVLAHPLPGALITQHWGQGAGAYVQYGLWGHGGTDFSAAQGTPIRCMADGIVEYAGFDVDYGNYVRVHHAQHNADTFYAHLLAASHQSSIGNQIFASEVVGQVGATGNTTGPHLHLEVRLRDGADYNPLTPMPKGRVDPETWCAMHGLRL